MVHFNKQHNKKIIDNFHRLIPLYNRHLKINKSIIFEIDIIKKTTRRKWNWGCNEIYWYIITSQTEYGKRHESIMISLISYGYENPCSMSVIVKKNGSIFFSSIIYNLFYGWFFMVECCLKICVWNYQVDTYRIIYVDCGNYHRSLKLEVFQRCI